MPSTSISTRPAATVYAMVVTGTVNIIQVVAAPIPGEATGIIGGYVFGVGWGFVYSSVALAIGSIINFAIGRLLGEKVVRRLVPAPAPDRVELLETAPLTISRPLALLNGCSSAAMAWTRR